MPSSTDTSPTARHVNGYQTSPLPNWMTGSDTEVSYRREISRGASEVHELYDNRTGRNFARKIIRVFGNVDVTNEIRVITKLRKAEAHRNIVQILRHGDFEYGSSTYYIDMEYCDINLRTFINGNWTPELRNQMPYFTIDLPPRLKIAQLWSIMEDIACGVAFLHGLGEVHRDIKPENVLYSAALPNSPSLRDFAWKITDFGLTAESAAGTQLLTFNARGTSCYRAPELIRGEERWIFTDKVDVWAIGCIFYELLFRQKAFSSDIDTREYSFSGDLEIPQQDSVGMWREISCADMTKALKILLAPDPNRRPTAAEVHKQFKTTPTSPSQLFSLYPTDGIALSPHQARVDNVDGHASVLSGPHISASMEFHPNRPRPPEQPSNENLRRDARRRSEMSETQIEPLIDPIYLSVNNANTRIATVVKKGDLIVQQLWDAETGRSLWRDRRVFEEPFGCYPNFGVKGPWVGFYNGSKIVVMDTNSPTIATPTISEASLQPQFARLETQMPSDFLVPYPIRAFAVGPNQEVAVAPKRVHRNQEGTFDIIKLKAEYPQLCYTSSGTHVFAVFKESDSSIYRKTEPYLVVRYFDVTGEADPHPLRLETERFIKQYQVLGIINHDQEECIVLDITFSESNSSRITGSRTLKTSNRCSRTWIAVLASGAYTEIKSFSRICDEDIVISEGRVFIVDFKGEVREWHSELRSVDHGGFVRHALPKGKVVAVRIREEYGSVTLLSDEGCFHFMTILPQRQRERSMTGVSIRSGAHVCQRCQSFNSEIR